MPVEFAIYLVRVLYVYAGIGIVLLPWWHLVGLRRLDLTAATGPWGFRILVSFGLAAFWPWLLLRARRAHGHPLPEHNTHRDRASAEVSP